jgi:hypothetical protein
MNFEQEINLLKNEFKQEINLLKNEFKQEINLLKKNLDNDKTNKLLEKDYQKLISKVLYGASHVKNKFGITDITNHNCHIEIKNWLNYKACLGQLFAYNLGDPKNNLIAAFFGDIKFKDRAIKLMHHNKINVWELNIINNELLIERYPYIPKEIQTFIDNHLLETKNDNDKINIDHLYKYNINSDFIPLVGYKFKDLNVLDNKIKLDKIKQILLHNFNIGDPKDFVKLKDIKECLKKNNMIENNVVILEKIIKETFEGVEFKKETHVNSKNYKSIFLKLKTQTQIQK